MSLPLGGFAKSGVDLRIGSLRCADYQILDKHCNLNIPTTARITQLCVREDAVMKGNVKVLGSTFSAEDEFTTLFTIEGNANVIIPPIEGEFNPMTLMITKCPCSGVIESVNPSTGNVSFCPSADPPGLDVYRYSIEDVCGIRHQVTQLVCRQITLMPPFINTACDRAIGFIFPPVDVDIKPFVVEGSSPTDYSTLTIKEVQVFSSSNQLPTLDCGGTPDVFALPYDPPCNMGQGVGCPFPPVFTFDSYSQPTPNTAVLSFLNPSPQTETWTVTHDNNGVITLTETASAGGSNTTTTSVKITYCVSNAEGTSNDGCLYIARIEPL